MVIRKAEPKDATGKSRNHICICIPAFAMRIIVNAN